MRATFRVLNTVALWLFSIVGTLAVLVRMLNVEYTPPERFLQSPAFQVTVIWHAPDWCTWGLGLALLIGNILVGRAKGSLAPRIGAIFNLGAAISCARMGILAADAPAALFMLGGAALFLFFAAALLAPESPAVPAAETPKPPETFARIDSLDLLRGIAILGIFLMNTWTMSLPQDAYTNPAIYAPDYVQGAGLPVASAAGGTAYEQFRPPQGSEYVTYTFIHLFADMKFITMFSMMFGAGILLQGERAASRGLKPWKIHYGRMIVLLAMGLIHAYCIWYGDILADYALCGMMIFPLRKLPSTVLMALGMLLIGSTSLISVAHFNGYKIPVVTQLETWSDQIARSNNDYELTVYRNQDIAAPTEIEGVTATRPVVAPVQGLPLWLGKSISGWWAEMKHRAWESFRGQTVDFFTWTFLRCGGSILIGMALMRMRFFRGEWSRQAYVMMALLLIPIGWMITYMGIIFNDAIGWVDGEGNPVFRVWGLGVEFNYWGSLLTELGYIAFGVLLAMWAADPSRTVLRACLVPIRCIGRMALSCYILESLIGTTLFYGHGFALFGTLWRVQLLPIVAAVWAILLIFAPLWLKYFKQGPLEWIWHRIVYWRGEPPPLRSAV